MPPTNYQYSIADDTPDGSVDSSRMLVEIGNADIDTDFQRIDTVGDVLDIWFVDALSGAEETTLNGLVAAHNFLAAVKAKKFAAIDVRTVELIETGYTFNGKKFSLSLPAQIRTMGIHQVRDNPAVVYPIKWNTRDDDEAVDVPDSATVDGMYLTGLGTYRAHVDGGTTLKDLVRAATTIAEVEAVVDPR